MSLSFIADTHCLPTKEFEKQYKNHLSGFNEWTAKEHCEEWMVFEKNIGEQLSVDEVNISNGELYTVVTNKAAKGRKGAIVAMIKGTKADDISRVLAKIPKKTREIAKEVTMDMADNMDAAMRTTFKQAKRVIDRFHVQQLVSEAVQEIRIALRRQALKEENEEIKKARRERRVYRPVIFRNGDTKKQLLARSRHLLFKPSGKWTDSQKQRAVILFEKYPELETAYGLSMMFRNCYENSKTRDEAKKNFNKWHKKIEEKNIEQFFSVSESIRLHETTILNYFINRSTNASAESFNAKLKGFRAVVRGVRDRKFHLFRVAKLYG